MPPQQPDIPTTGVDVAALCSCHTTSMSTPTGEIVVVRVFGDVDQASEHVLQAALAEARDRGAGHVVVDVAGLGFCSVRGLALLVQARSGAAVHRGEYVLSGVGPNIERFLTLIWPADTLPVRYPSAAVAVLAAMAHQRVRRSRVPLAPHPARHTTRPGLRAVGDPEPIAELTDHELTEHARGGDDHAYRELARRHRTRMYRSALHMLGSSDDPEDVAQDITTRLRTALAAFDDANPP